MESKRRRFGKEFKREAIRLVEAGGRSAMEVAESLGIDPSLLSKWMKSHREEGEEAFRGHGKRTAVEEEIWRLKQRNRALEQELEFRNRPFSGVLAPET